MESTGVVSSELIKEAVSVLQRRLDMLKKFAPDSIKESIDLDQAALWIDQIRCFAGSSNYQLKTLLLIDMTVSATRVWEAWNKDPATGQALFPEWSNPDRQQTLVDMLLERFHIMRNAFGPGSVNRIRDFTREETADIIDAAVTDFINAKSSVYDFRAHSDPNEIHSFTQSMRFYVFSGILSTSILGISSVDGRRVYISEQTLLTGTPKQIVVHELAHNWAIWSKDRSNLLVSGRTPLYSLKGIRRGLH